MHAGKTDTFLVNLLQSRPEAFGNILLNRDALKVQIIYTQINRQADNTPVFQPYYFNVDSGSYFYPASTVKMPVALMALQRLNELKVFGLNSHSTMITENSYSGQTPVFNDPTTTDGRPTIAHYIKKIFLVSDNDAFNRLYEFLGQQYINEQLHKLGYTGSKILHRLSIALSEDENRHTNPIRFFADNSKLLYTQPMQFNRQQYPVWKATAGTGYYRSDSLIPQPMDFSFKNRIGLEDLTGILKSVIFPDAVPAGRRFNLTEEDRRMVLQYMSQFPPESDYPSYDSTYPDAYGKFLLYGARKDTLPRQVRIFNKIGDAYGFMTDVAYVADFENNIEFMLSATIYCNRNEILNNDNYDYDTIGFPFMKNLGRLIYDYELARPRSNKPDLSAFRMTYDK